MRRGRVEEKTTACFPPWLPFPSLSILLSAPVSCTCYAPLSLSHYSFDSHSC